MSVLISLVPPVLPPPARTQETAPLSPTIDLTGEDDPTGSPRSVLEVDETGSDDSTPVKKPKGKARAPKSPTPSPRISRPSAKVRESNEEGVIFVWPCKSVKPPTSPPAASKKKKKAVKKRQASPQPETSYLDHLREMIPRIDPNTLEVAAQAIGGPSVRFLSPNRCLSFLNFLFLVFPGLHVLHFNQCPLLRFRGRRKEVQYLQDCKTV